MEGILRFGGLIRSHGSRYDELTVFVGRRSSGFWHFPQTPTLYGKATMIALRNARPLIKHDTKRLAVMVFTVILSNDENLLSREARWRGQHMCPHDSGWGRYCTISHEAKHRRMHLHIVCWWFQCCSGVALIWIGKSIVHVLYTNTPVGKFLGQRVNTQVVSDATIVRVG